MGNWNPTENCFLTIYHPSFMVHWWVMVHFHHTHELTLMGLLVARIGSTWHTIEYIIVSTRPLMMKLLLAHWRWKCAQLHWVWIGPLHPKLLRVDCSFSNGIAQGLSARQNQQTLAHCYLVHNCHSFYENYTLHPKLLRVNCSFKCIWLAYEDILRSSKLVCKLFPNDVWQNLSWVCQITSDYVQLLDPACNHPSFNLVLPITIR